MCDPSQFRATYSTNAEVYSLYHSPGHMVLEEVLLLENKLLQASLLSTLFSADSFQPFFGAVLPGVFLILPKCLLLFIAAQVKSGINNY